MSATGYSGTPQLRKLGILPGRSWDVDGEPEGWRFETAPDPEARIVEGPVDIVLAFVPTRAALLPTIERHEERIRPAGAIWIAWPRKAGGHVSDLAEQDIRDAALPRGLVDVKVAAIDHDWSGLKIVWRRERR